MPTGFRTVEVKGRFGPIEDRGAPVRDVLLNIDNAFHTLVRLDLDLWISNGDKCVASTWIFNAHQVRQFVLKCSVLYFLIHEELFKLVMAVWATLNPGNALFYIAELTGAEV